MRHLINFAVVIAVALTGMAASCEGIPQNYPQEVGTDSDAQIVYVPQECKEAAVTVVGEEEYALAEDAMFEELDRLVAVYKDIPGIQELPLHEQIPAIITYLENLALGAELSSYISKQQWDGLNAQYTEMRGDYFVDCMDLCLTICNCECLSYFGQEAMEEDLCPRD